MFKKIALLTVLSAFSSTAFAYQLCSASQTVNAACDFMGKRGYCYVVPETDEHPAFWACGELPVEGSHIPDAYTIGGVGETGGSTDIFEVVECVEDRDIWVETNPGGTSDDICDVLYEFFVGKDGEVVFVNTETSPLQEYVEKSR